MSESPLTYGSYLHLDEILGAQHPVAPEAEGPAVLAAEHFFIVTHQAALLERVADEFVWMAAGQISKRTRELSAPAAESKVAQ